jgi:hypothetical protein
MYFDPSDQSSPILLQSNMFQIPESLFLRN